MATPGYGRECSVNSHFLWEIPVTFFLLRRKRMAKFFVLLFCFVKSFKYTNWNWNEIKIHLRYNGGAKNMIQNLIHDFGYPDEFCRLFDTATDDSIMTTIAAVSFEKKCATPEKCILYKFYYCYFLRCLLRPLFTIISMYENIFFRRNKRWLGFLSPLYYSGKSVGIRVGKSTDGHNDFLVNLLKFESDTSTSNDIAIINHHLL